MYNKALGKRKTEIIIIKSPIKVPKTSPEEVNRPALKVKYPIIKN
jgi:hypothetical protein